MTWLKINFDSGMIAIMLYMRHLAPHLLAAAGDTPAILLLGARQTGKSTLLSHLELDGAKMAKTSLDDLTVLGALQANPQSYLTELGDHVFLDEVQRLPEMFLSIKEAIDRDRRPGRFFLTGSANVLMLPKLADTLAGRVELATLWPLSQGELRGQREGFLAMLFGHERPGPVSPIAPQALFQMLWTGGYPEAVQRSGVRQQRWFASYVATILQRDVQQLSQIEGLTNLPRLLTLLASRSGSLLNTADLCRSLGLPHTTVQRYLSLLEAVYLTVRVPPWFSNLGKRLVRSPRIYLNDTGILCHLLGIDQATAQRDRNLLGPVLENFVVMELHKQMSWHDDLVRLSHFRTHQNDEVDIVLEQGTKVVGIEVKAAASLSPAYFKGLMRLQEQAGPAFHRGVVLYTGSEVVPFGNHLWGLPIASLWES